MVLVADPWCFGVTAREPLHWSPTWGPPEEKKHLEGMEPQPEEQFAGWEQMLERVAAMQRDQAGAPSGLTKQVLTPPRELGRRRGSGGPGT